MIDIKLFLANLKDGKSNKTKESLDKLNDILKAYIEDGRHDFAYTTVGRISEDRGGVGYSSIRATQNTHYRQLIDAWSTQVLAKNKKPVEIKQKGQDYQLLKLIDDISIRAHLSQIIRERDIYKREVDEMKRQWTEEIDLRPVPASTRSEIDVLPSLKGVCTVNEIKALKYACSKQLLEDKKWREADLGQIVDSLGDEVFPRGFLLGLRKLVGEVDE